MVRIADDVFGWGDEYDTYSNERILVRGAFPPDDGIDALLRAAARFMLVDETGVEHPPGAWDVVPHDEDGDELYTPNYVSDPEPVPGGLRLYVDCKGVIDPRMRARFLQILREELASLGDDVDVEVAD